MEPPADPPFIGDFFKERKLGAGAFGTVDLWRNKKTNQCVAIKRMHSAKGEHIARWQNEIDLLSNKIRHPNIVAVQLVGGKLLEELQNLHPHKVAALALEYCEMGDLRRALQRPENCNGFDEQEVRTMLKSLSAAIAYLHDLTIIHRDLKPENIVMKRQGDSIVYKLTDLGYAKAMSKQDNSTLAGTEEYVAPELLTSDKYSYSADYWSFGIIAFEIICGWRPFIPHASLAKRLLAIAEKKSDHICITEGSKVEDYTYYSQLFPENQISKSLKPLLEKWLALALEYNPKQRGYVFERGGCADSVTDPTASADKPKVKFVDEIGKGPQQVLKIFGALDEALKRKFLTFFCMHTYTFFEMEIDATTTMSDLYAAVERATGVRRVDCELVLPLHQKYETITSTMKPLDLYINVDECQGRPMLFVGRAGQLVAETKPNVSASIQEIMKAVKTKLRPHCFKRFVSDACFLVRGEQRRYATLLDGLKNHGVRMNDVILRQKLEVQRMMKLCWSLNGSLELFVITLSQAKERIEDKKLMSILGNLVQIWEENSTKMEYNVLKLTEAADKINKRHESVLKRSREVLVHYLLRNPHEEVFDLTGMKTAFEKARAMLKEKQVHEKSHHEMMQVVYECLKKRDTLLKSVGLKELQQHLIAIKIETEEIGKATEKAIQQGDKYVIELRTMNKELHEQLWDRESIYDYLPDLERMLEQSRIYESMNLGNGQPSFKIGAEMTPTVLKTDLGAKSLRFDGIDATSLICDNESLILATEDLIQEGFRQLSEL